MAERAETYAFARSVPYLLQRGQAQTISAPIRHGGTGAIVAVTEAGSTVSIKKPDGNYLVSDAAVSVSSSIATYLVTPAASEALGSGWTVEWSLVIDGQTYPYREAAYLCEWFPHNVISVLDLYTEIPELRYNVPQAQAVDVTRGDGTGWQPQVDQAFYDLIRMLLDNGRPVWKLREHSTGVREWVLSKALHRCIQAIPRKADSTWALQETRAWQRHNEAGAKLVLQYDDEASTTRRGGLPYYRIAPVGRPLW